MPLFICGIIILTLLLVLRRHAREHDALLAHFEALRAEYEASKQATPAQDRVAKALERTKLSKMAVEIAENRKKLQELKTPPFPPKKKTWFEQVEEEIGTDVFDLEGIDALEKKVFAEHPELANDTKIGSPGVLLRGKFSNRKTEILKRKAS